MKCLCCGQTFVDQSLLKNRYLAQHNVDENTFLKNSFQETGFLCLGNVFDVTISV